MYVDFQKAFDSVSRQKQITKLKGYGIYGNLLSGLNHSGKIGRVQKRKTPKLMEDWCQLWNFKVLSSTGSSLNMYSKVIIKTPPHLKCVATLPCKVCVFEK